eukprot:1272230-Lingulodinium_polyedra.AAC.1
MQPTAAVARGLLVVDGPHIVHDGPPDRKPLRTGNPGPAPALRREKSPPRGLVRARGRDGGRAP